MVAVVTAAGARAVAVGAKVARATEALVVAGRVGAFAVVEAVVVAARAAAVAVAAMEERAQAAVAAAAWVAVRTKATKVVEPLAMVMVVAAPMAT
eukprot:3543302-Prymnesium_polylepis.1